MKQNIKVQKGIVYALLVLLLAFGVTAWGAARSISGNDVTITVDSSASGSSIFTVQETLSVGSTFTTFPGTCNENPGGTVLTCDYNSDSPVPITYGTTGTGTVSGEIIGRDVGATSSTSKAITGDTAIPSAVACADECAIGPITVTQCSPTGQVQICGEYDSDTCTEWGGNILCPDGQTCDSSSGTCVASCTTETDAEFCSRLGKNCDSVIANDNCGTARTVSSCGTCSGTDSCVNNVCTLSGTTTQTVGQQVDAVFDSEGIDKTAPVAGSWTTKLISRLAALFRSLFGG